MKQIHTNLTVLFFWLLFTSNLQAGNPVGTWKTYMAYQDPVQVTETSGLVFAVYKGLYPSSDENVHNDGSLFSYSQEDKEIVTYSPNDGLNDTEIKSMAYSPEMKVLLLVYDNSNVDLFYGKNNVVNLPDITKKDYLDKTINSITIIGKYAYLSAAFGVAVIDLERQEMRDPFYPDANTMAICLWGDYFYAATTDGVKRALKSLNLMDPENWEAFPLYNCGDEKRIEKMLLFKDHLVFFNAGNNNTYYRKKDEPSKLLLNDACRDLTVLNEQLIICGKNSISFYADFDRRTKIDKTALSISSRNSSHIYWIVQPETGLAGIRKEINSNEYSAVPMPEIKINSPLRNYTFFMSHTAGKLLVTGGHTSRNLPGTFMIYEDGKWTNFDEQLIAQKTGLMYNKTPWCRDFLSVAVDPRDHKHYYVGSFHDGVYEFQDTAFVKLHTYTNTNHALQTVLPNNSYPELYVRSGGLAFDRYSNLYVLNARVQYGLSVLTKDNLWKPFYYPNIADSWMYKLLIDRNNQKWIARYWDGAGIFVLNDNNTIDNVSDDTYYFATRFVDQQGEDINATTYNCLAEDLNGIIWVGTDNGPISFSSAEQVGRRVCNRIIATDRYNEGYRPLEGESVTAIAVDGGNRKWIGTSTGGVFVLNNTGENVQVDNFNTTNSGIISDAITSIAINNKTGEVFIGTSKGLVSYMSEVIEGSPDYSEVYAFPNPVKPASHSQVIITGLIANSSVKITDIAGNLINQGESLGGQYSWNCTNRSGAIVKAGIYLVFAALPDGSQGVVTKIMVIK
jgi:hypothetical protein